MTDLSEFDPFSPLPDELTLNSLPSPISPLQAKLGDLTISSVEDVGSKRGFVEDEGEQGSSSHFTVFSVFISVSPFIQNSRVEV